MKKILTASLVAMMAVTAANANIASTKYVDDRTGTLSGFVQENTNLTTAVNVLAATVSTNAGAASDAANQALTDAKLYTDALADGAVKTNTDAIAGMDLDSVGADGSYIKTVSQENGNVTAVAEAADVAPTQNSTKMVTSGGVHTALALKENVANKATTEYAEGSTTQYPSIKIAEDIANKAVSATKADLSTLQTAVATLNGGVDKEGSVAKAVNDAKSELQGELDTAVADLQDADTANLQAAKTYTDTEIGKINSAETGILKQAKDYTDALADGAVKTNTNAIDAINNAESGILAQAKKHSDDADATQTAALQTYADTAETDAVTSANSYTDAEIAKINSADTGILKQAKDYTDALAEGAVADNTAAIDELEASAQVKSTADFQFGGANGTWKDITTLPEYCGKANATCSLVSKNGTIQWELVEY